MKVIREGYKQILSKYETLAKKDTTKNGHLQCFLLSYYTNEGVLLYNMLTNELILCGDSDDIFGDWFYEHLFCVNDDVDELKLAIEIKQDWLSSRFKEFNISSYIILPTSECNARCFYCYENGKRQISMTEKTAEDIADFIMRKTPEGPILLSWFGGEPLYNQKPIDIITKRLRENGRDFASTITTNGYLFNKNTIEKAKKEWNLKFAQITIDGLDETYKTVKNYKNKTSSPLKKVLSNITCLAKNEIEVGIRINVGNFNAKESVDLARFLVTKYKKFEKYVKIYSHELFELNPNDIKNEQQEKDVYGYMGLIDDIAGAGTLPIKGNYHCMADSKSAVVILPNGKLGLCQHYIDSNTIGSIYDENLDEEKIKEFEEVEIWEECFYCSLFPICSHLKMCEDWGTGCSEQKKIYKIGKLYKQMNNEFEEYKKAHPDFTPKKRNLLCIYNEP